MRKLLDNLHPQNFNSENPGFMLNREIYMPRKIPGIRYTVFGFKYSNHGFPLGKNTLGKAMLPLRP